MKTRHEIHDQARRILMDTADKHPKYAIHLQQTAIEVSGRMTLAAGTAHTSKNLIKLSLPYFADDSNFDKFLANVVTHEAAHLIAHTLAKAAGRRIKSHGWEWQSIHRALGGDGKRCHSLKLAEGFKPRKKQPLVAMPCCRCSKEILLKPIRARNYAEGIKRGSLGPGTGYGYMHRECASKAK